MSSNFTTSPQFAHYENVTLLGPPTMRGAIVFSGSSHPKLVEGMCDRLGMRPGSATLGKFKNGETSVTIRAYIFCPHSDSLTNAVQTLQFATKMSLSSKAGARSA